MFENKVIYQVYPKSFYDSNGDGFGDIKGMTHKLDYLKKLGVDVIWSTPFFVSPQHDNGYDVEDYRAIDPRYGTMEDFEELVQEAKKRDMDIMLDMVFNHTSTKHRWFQKALDNDPYYQDYYFFKKTNASGIPPTNWESKFGGNAWEYVENLNSYYLHLFDKTQADLNWENPHVRDEIVDILNFWIAKGVYGFRFDVINLISKPACFEDDHEGDGRRYYTDGRHVHHFLKEVNQRTFGNDERIITVGEMSSTSLANCVQYAGKNMRELNMVFNFHHLKVDYKDKQKWGLKPFDFHELKRLFHTWQLGMQKHQAWNALFWCNHDQPRAISRIGNDQQYHQKSAKMLATSIHMMRGTPYIYQGEELGMTNAYFNDIQQYCDIESINYYHIMKEQGLAENDILHILQERSRDNSRTPMQWTDEVNAGFTSCTPWISITKNYKTINAKQNLQERNSIFYHYQKLISLRKSYTIIAQGTYQPLLCEHEQVFAYQRMYNDEHMIVVNNFYGQQCQIELPEDIGYEVLLSNDTDQAYAKTMVLRPYESIVFYAKKVTNSRI